MAEKDINILLRVNVPECQHISQVNKIIKVSSTDTPRDVFERFHLPGELKGLVEGTEIEEDLLREVPVKELLAFSKEKNIKLICIDERPKPLPPSQNAFDLLMSKERAFVSPRTTRLAGF